VRIKLEEYARICEEEHSEPLDLEKLWSLLPGQAFGAPTTPWIS
jgi:hypothetical protein